MIEARYIDLSEKIEAGIKKGLWKDRMPGVIKLSRELDANPATVSKAFKLLSEKGLLTIDGTKGTYITKQGSRTKHKVIGVIGIRPDISYYFEEWAAMEEKAKEKGYRIIGIAHNNELFVKDMKLLLQFPVDGYIFMYSSMTAEIAAFLRRNGISFVACSKTVGLSGINYVDFDPESIFEKGMRHLIELGHRRIAYVEFNNPNYSYSERILNLYKKIISEAGLPLDESLFISRNQYYYYNIYKEDYCREYGRVCAEELTAHGKKFSAALISSVNMADGFIDGLKKHNLKCPDDVSIVAYNERLRAETFFTDIELDHRGRASEVTAMLTELIDNPWNGAKQKLIESKLAVRKSSIPAGKHDTVKHAEVRNEYIKI